jgi:hypothetical protein
MVDIDTFLTILSVRVDDFCQASLPPERRPGPAASLSRSEVLTLALRGQWQCFESERAFYRYALRHGRGAFPTLPDRAQFNRRVRQHAKGLVACFRYRVEVLQAQPCPFEALDSTPAPTREAKRRSLGWLPGLADLGGGVGRLSWADGRQVCRRHHRLGLWGGQHPGPAARRDLLRRAP